MYYGTLILHLVTHYVNITPLYSVYYGLSVQLYTVIHCPPLLGVLRYRR